MAHTLRSGIARSAVAKGSEDSFRVAGHSSTIPRRIPNVLGKLSITYGSYFCAKS